MYLLSTLTRPQFLVTNDANHTEHTGFECTANSSCTAALFVSCRFPFATEYICTDVSVGEHILCGNKMADGYGIPDSSPFWEEITVLSHVKVGDHVQPGNLWSDQGIATEIDLKRQTITMIKWDVNLWPLAPKRLARFF